MAPAAPENIKWSCFGSPTFNLPGVTATAGATTTAKVEAQVAGNGGGKNGASGLMGALLAMGVAVAQLV